MKPASSEGIPSDGLSTRNFSEGRDSFPERISNAILWRFRSQLLVMADAVLVLGSCLAAYHIRFSLERLSIFIPVKDAIPDPRVYIIASLMISVTWILLIWRDGGYKTSLYSLNPMSYQFRSVVGAGAKSVGLLMASSFLLRPLLISRVFLIMAFGLALIMTVLIRLSLSMLDRWLGARGIVLNRFVVLGSIDHSTPFIRRLNAFKGSLRVTGAISIEQERDTGLQQSEELPDLGNIHDVEAIYERQRFNGLVFATNGYDYVCHPAAKDAVMGALNFCESKGIPFYIVPDSLDVAVARSEVGSFCGFPVIRLRDSAVHPVYGAIKRILDVALSLLGLILGLPVWAGIAATIRLTSKGPAIYSQIRMGANGRPFRMYKFRTMVWNAEKLLDDLVDFDALKEPVFKLKNDPRVTRFGGILRRTGLDEAPQLLNVLLGHMSLVGPRPEQVELVDKYTVWQKRRLKGKPGITGYQQVMSRGDPVLSRRVDYDLYYLKNQSFLLDLFILCKTIVVVIKGEGIK